MSPSLRSVLRAVLVGAFAATAASPAAAADKVAVGTGGSASDAPFYIAHDRGFFKDEGLDVDLIVLDSGAKVIAPLGTGELDVGSGALSVGFWNALIRGVKFRIVADRGHTEPGYLYQTVFMRKDLIDSGQFKSLKDLKGMRMGFRPARRERHRRALSGPLRPPRGRRHVECLHAPARQPRRLRPPSPAGSRGCGPRASRSRSRPSRSSPGVSCARARRRRLDGGSTRA